MTYDDWKTRTPEEDRAVFRRLHHIRRDPEDGPEEQECPSCGEIEPLDEDYQLCPHCLKEFLADPPEVPDDEDLEDTPILTDPEDPGEHLEPHKPDLGGES